MNQSSGTLSHDVIGGNGVYRPHLNDALSAHVEDGRVVGNGQLGLSIFERTSPTVEQNVIGRSGYQGIGAQDQATPDTVVNIIRLHRQSGVT